MIRKIYGIYSIIIGISILGMWSMIILTEGTTEGITELAFHLISEILMAILLIVSGLYLLKGKVNGGKVLMLAQGMLIYSVLNAAGYYGQRGNNGMTFMFIIIFIISCILTIINIRRWEMV